MKGLIQDPEYIKKNKEEVRSLLQEINLLNKDGSATSNTSVAHGETKTSEKKTMETDKYIQKTKKEFDPEHPAIVIVEDEMVAAHNMYIVLHRQKYNTKIYSNPETALQEICNFTPVLMFVDLKLPEMNGLQFILKVRNELKLDPHIVIVTGYLSEQIKTTVAKIGQIDIVPKPFKADKIIEFAKKFGLEAQKET